LLSTEFAKHIVLQCAIQIALV